MLLIILLVTFIIIMFFLMSFCDINTIKKKLNINVSDAISENILNLEENNYESFKNYPGTYWRNPNQQEKLYENIVVSQGHQLPLESSIATDPTINGPTLDGTKNTSNSMFMFSKNQCKPECCPSTYSCSGGCVCTTKEQRRYVGETRGNNKTTSEYDEF